MGVGGTGGCTAGRGGGGRRIRRDLAGPNLLVERGRFGGGVYPQLFLEQVTAGLELGQGSAALPAARQQPHQAPVGFLLPRGQVHLFPGGFNRFGQVSGLFVMPGQALEGRQAAPLELLAHPQQPFFKRGAVFELKPLQEGTPVQRDAFQQGIGWLVRSGQRLKGLHVHPAIRGPVELERVAPGDQQRGGRFAVADGFTQVGQGIAQIGEGGKFGPIGPQQADQRLARVRPLWLGCQVGQQRPHAV